MSWSTSKWFYQTVIDGLGNTTALDLDADIPKVALYNDSITPDATVSAANSAYNAGVWVTGANNVNDATGWPSAGRVLVSPTWTKTSNVLTYDANDTASANSTTTLASVYGVLVYDDTLAAVVVDQGICFNYLGGTNSVTSGTFTVVWNTSGICALTL